VHFETKKRPARPHSLRQARIHQKKLSFPIHRKTMHQSKLHGRDFGTDALRHPDGAGCRHIEDKRFKEPKKPHHDKWLHRKK